MGVPVPHALENTPNYVGVAGRIVKNADTRTTLADADDRRKNRRLDRAAGKVMAREGSAPQAPIAAQQAPRNAAWFENQRTPRNLTIEAATVGRPSSFGYGLNWVWARRLTSIPG